MINDIIRLVSKLPPEGLALVGKLIRAILSSPDPMRAARRAATAAAASKASEEVLKRTLKGHA